MVQDCIQRPLGQAVTQPCVEEGPRASPGFARRRVLELAVLAGVVLAGLALRCQHLAARSLWFDEAFSWRLTRFPLVDMLARTTGDDHPPLYFLLLKGWTTLFGTSPPALRSLSVVFACLTIVGMYLFSREALLDDERRESPGQRGDHRGLPLFVAALVAVSVFQARWGWETRMYTLGTALLAFSSWTLFRALRSPGPRLRWWLTYAVLALLFAYTHYYALFSLAAQGAFVAGYLLHRSRLSIPALLKDPDTRHALLAGGLVTLGWLPWFSVFLAQRHQVQSAFWSVPLTAWDVPNVCYQMFLEPEGADFSHTQALVAAVGCGLGLLALLWRPRAGVCYVVLAAAGPFALSVLVSLFDTKLFHLRYFLYAHLFILAGLALLVYRVPSPMARLFLALPLLSYGLGVAVGFSQDLDVAHRPGARGAADYLVRQRAPGEPVVVASPLFYFPLLYHLDSRAPCSLYSNGEPVVHYEGGAIVTPQDLIADDQLRATGSRRVWVVNMAGGGWGTRQVPVPASWFAKSERHFPEVYPVQGDVIVLEYETNTGAPPAAAVAEGTSPPPGNPSPGP